MIIMIKKYICPPELRLTNTYSENEKEREIKKKDRKRSGKENDRTKFLCH